MPQVEITLTTILEPNSTVDSAIEDGFSLPSANYCNKSLALYTSVQIRLPLLSYQFLALKGCLQYRVSYAVTQIVRQLIVYTILH